MNTDTHYNFQKVDADVAKGVGICMLLMYHLFYKEEVVYEYSPSFFPLGYENIYLLISGMKMCVCIFVFLTSYGISAQIGDLESRDIVSKQSAGRFVRLMEKFIVASIFAMLLCFLFDKEKFSVYGTGVEGAFNMAVDGLGLEAYFHTPTICNTWWYISFAYMLVFLVPFCCYLYNKLGNVILAVVFFLPVYLNLEESSIGLYLLSVFFGIFFHKNDCIIKFRKWTEKEDGFLRVKIVQNGIKFLICILMLGAFFWIRQYEKAIFLIDTFGAIIIVLFSYSYLSKIPIINYVLQKLGKYSLYIFVLHTVIKDIWINQIFSLNSAWVMWGILLAVSYICAWCLDILEKKLFRKMYRL